MLPEQFYMKFLDYGVIGCVLAWLLLKTDTRLKGIEDAVNRLTDAITLALIAQEGIPEHIRNRAMKLKEDVDTAIIERRAQERRPPRG